MQIQVCFAESNPNDRLITLPGGRTVTVPAGTGMWLDFEPDFHLPATEHADEIMEVVLRIALPDGMVALRVLTSTEIWTFHWHPTYGMVPRLEIEAGEVVERWPSNKELGGTWVVNHVLPDGHLLPLCYVEPAPTFLMGDSDAQNRRKVDVPGGFLALTPTTVRQWNWYCAHAGKTPKATKVTDNKTGAVIDVSDFPVTEVSYWDACEWAQWAGVGIPTEEQWEHAARGNDGRKFPWGNQAPTPEVCHSSVQTQQERPDDVYNRPAGASPYGCLDMSGNVWEWTSTVHR
jgi:formylglycine-generating enzyme required for sulfatase activity